MEDNSGAKVDKIDEAPYNLGYGPDAELGWRKEADAVIQDIKKHVKYISVSESIKVSVLKSS